MIDSLSVSLVVEGVNEDSDDEVDLLAGLEHEERARFMSLDHIWAMLAIYQ